MYLFVNKYMCHSFHCPASKPLSINQSRHTIILEKTRSLVSFQSPSARFSLISVACWIAVGTQIRNCLLVCRFHRFQTIHSFDLDLMISQGCGGRAPHTQSTTF